MDVNKYKNALFKCFSIIVALSTWEIVARIIHERILLVGPLEVAYRLTSIWKEPGFFATIWFTFEHIVLGFLIGFLLGCFLAAIAYKLKAIEILLWPWMATVKSVPVASFVVICLIWLTPANLGVFISFLVVLPVVYQNILQGLKAQDKNLLEMSDLFNVSFLKKCRHIILPSISPYIISACKVTAGMAWKAGVAAEIIGIPEGSIGKMLYLSKIYLDTKDLLAWTVVIVVMSVAFEKVIVMLIQCVPGINVSHRRKKNEG